MAAKIRLTKDLFLWSMSVIYLFAFASLFVQIPGLYGNKGILPARLVLQNEADSFYDLVTNQPTLLRLLPKVGLDVQTGMDFLSLGGIIVSFVAMVSHDYRNSAIFTLLWVFYLSLFQVGQTFIWFQWDLLLLEAGFIAVIVAPLNFFGFHKVVEHHAHDQITMWLVRWLLFRLTFASGVVKLLSKSTAWWSLTAMKYHYETQLLPTPMAWLFHQFPDWWHQLSTVAIIIIQIPVSLFFFSPSSKQQHFAFYCQIAHLILLILSGNFSFYPLLVLALCLSLIDDDFINQWIGHLPEVEKDHPRKSPHSRWLVIAEKVFLLVTFAGLAFSIFSLFTFNVQVSPPRVEPEIAFSPEDLEMFLAYVLPLTIAVGATSLVWQIAEAIFSVLSNKRRLTNDKVQDLVGCVFFGLVAFSIFSISLVPHVTTQKDVTGMYLPEKLQDVYSWTSQNYRLANPYYLYHRTSDENKGRLEIVIEGSYKLHGSWKEYGFRYKPNDVTSKLSIAAPHHPRLDSQMWFAAKGHFDQSPWFLNFVFHLLKNQKEVLELMDANPFPNKAPKYIRAILYRYHFATKSAKTDKFSASDWWVREPVREYLPPLTLDEPSFVSYLMEAGIYVEGEELSAADDEHNFLYLALEMIRSLLGQASGNLACLLLVVSGFILSLVDPSIILPTEDELQANGISSRSPCGK